MDPQTVLQILVALGAGGALSKGVEFLVRRRSADDDEGRVLRLELRDEIRSLRDEARQLSRDLAAALAREAALTARLEGLQSRLAAFERIDAECDELRTKLSLAERTCDAYRLRLEAAGLPVEPPRPINPGPSAQL